MTQAECSCPFCSTQKDAPLPKGCGRFTATVVCKRHGTVLVQGIRRATVGTSRRYALIASDGREVGSISYPY